MAKCAKVAYGNKQKAHHAMRAIMQAGKPMRAYKCPNCYKYHLTSKLDDHYARLR